MSARKFLLALRSVVAVVSVVAACGGAPLRDSDGDVVLVSAAISLSGALEETIELYRSTTGREVVLNLGGSDTLATQAP